MEEMSHSMRDVLVRFDRAFRQKFSALPQHARERAIPIIEHGWMAGAKTIRLCRTTDVAVVETANLTDRNDSADGLHCAWIGRIVIQ